MGRWNSAVEGMGVNGMKKAIVSGANGFVGSALVKELLAHGYQVTALYKEGSRHRLADHERLILIPFEFGSGMKLTDVIKKGSYDAFYHFAWAGSAGEARADVGLQLKNVLWTVDSLRAAKQLGCSKFVPAGSIMEHETAAASYKQGNQPASGYIYGGAKLTAHVMCMSVAAQVGIDLVCPQITNAYGIGELSPRLVNTTIRKCIKKEPPKFSAATQNYDFVYIDDVARAFRLIAEHGKPFHTYLIGSSDAKPLKEFLLEMKSEIAPSLEFLFGDIPFTGVDLPLEQFSTEQTEKDTGFRASVSFAEGTKRTMEWLMAIEGVTMEETV